MTFPNTDAPLTTRRVTVYVQDDLMGTFVRMECTAYQAHLLPYAQFRDAVHVRLVMKGKRREQGYVETDAGASTLVLDGWGHPQPKGMYPEADVEIPEGQSAVVVQGRGGRTSPMWQQEFSAMIDRHVAGSGATVLADFRGHNPAARV